jgi:hypothetical protein
VYFPVRYSINSGSYIMIHLISYAIFPDYQIGVMKVSMIMVI